MPCTVSRDSLTAGTNVVPAYSRQFKRTHTNFSLSTCADLTVSV